MRFRRALRPLAWTLVACILLTAGWAAFMIADPFAGQRQQDLQHQLFRQWQHRSAGPGERAGASGHGAGLPRAAADAIASRAANPDHLTLRKGRPFALIRIPRFGHGWRFAIVQGTALSQLALGPGHVPGTGLPGARGNFVVAAHDVTAGNPFLHLKSLRSPDKIYVYTRTHVYEYRVRSERVVRYTSVGVQDPVPGHPNTAPRRSLITLITCTPVTLEFTPWRIVVTGELLRVGPRR